MILCTTTTDRTHFRKDILVKTLLLSSFSSLHPIPYLVTTTLLLGRLFSGPLLLFHSQTFLNPFDLLRQTPQPRLNLD